jgi:adenylate cyclase
MNEYLSAMTDIIEQHGGFVDKYIGDAIVAVFGAPLDDPDHAVKAVRAALACQARLAELRSAGGAFASHRLNTRIGLNSGEALVGNIGSHRHFNYTVMGDVVNIAARLEDANRYFGSAIMASEATMALTRTTFVWRELDLLRVRGRDAPVRVFEPLAVAEQLNPELETRVAIYANGLAGWRARDFAAAARHFALIGGSDAPAAIFRDRAEALARQPPAADWEPITAQG